jgi:hypothetical protein
MQGKVLIDYSNIAMQLAYSPLCSRQPGQVGLGYIRLCTVKSPAQIA